LRAFRRKLFDKAVLAPDAVALRAEPLRPIIREQRQCRQRGEQRNPRQAIDKRGSSCLHVSKDAVARGKFQIQNTRGETPNTTAPNTKHQAPNTRKAPKFQAAKRCAAQGFWDLVLGVYLVFGVWCVELLGGFPA